VDNIVVKGLPEASGLAAQPFYSLARQGSRVDLTFEARTIPSGSEPLPSNAWFSRAGHRFSASPATNNLSDILPRGWENQAGAGGEEPSDCR